VRWWRPVGTGPRRHGRQWRTVGGAAARARTAVFRGRPSHVPAAARRRGATRPTVARGQMSQWLEVAARQRGATWPVVVCNQGGGGAGDGWRCVRRVRARDGRWWCRAQVEEAVWRWLGHEWRVRVSGPARRGSCEFNYF
jgi:hypothetical protein